MRWTIPSREEADEFTKAYLAAQESYYDELEFKEDFFENKEIMLMNEWISVKDRLPERNGFYLAYDGKYIGSVEYEKGRADSEWTDDYEGYLNLNVTHWMPLPEPPKEEG